MDGMSERVSLKFLSCSASKYIIIVFFFIQGSLKKPLLPLLSILSPEEQDEVLYQVVNQFLTPSNYNYNCSVIFLDVKLLYGFICPSTCVSKRYLSLGL